MLPVVAALTRQLVADAWRGNGEQLRSMGAGALASAALLLLHERLALVTVLLTAFGRAISEVGAVMIVGGNIDGVTRVMTTTIALETSKGDLPLALAWAVLLARGRRDQRGDRAGAAAQQGAARAQAVAASECRRLIERCTTPACASAH